MDTHALLQIYIFVLAGFVGYQVITTAQVPGARAPVLIDEAAVRGMRPGSVIVDLAAEGGGNCALTRAGEDVQAHGVTILGPVNLPSAHALHASQLFSRNLQNFLIHLAPEGKLVLDLEDEVTRAWRRAAPPSARGGSLLRA